MNDTYWDDMYDVERCSLCDKIIVDSFHDCKDEVEGEDDYSKRLKYGFDLLDMGD